jgi:translation initiation factor IF-3
METKAALQLAESQGLDLAEVAPTSQPPVCKILDFGKYKYQLKKKQKVAKKKQVVTILKEVQFRPQTDIHDIEFKVKHILRFLAEGNKVKVSIRFRGREATHVELGHILVKQIIDLVGNWGIVEQNPKMEGKVLSLIFAPNPKAKKVGTKTNVTESGSKNSEERSTNDDRDGKSEVPKLGSSAGTGEISGANSNRG